MSFAQELFQTSLKNHPIVDRVKRQLISAAQDGLVRTEIQLDIEDFGIVKSYLNNEGFVSHYDDYTRTMSISWDSLRTVPRTLDFGL